eukprot:gene650-1196_t
MASLDKRRKTEEERSTFCAEAFELVASVVARRNFLDLEDLASVELVNRGICEQIQPKDWLDALTLLLDSDADGNEDLELSGHRASHDVHIYCTDATIWDYENDNQESVDWFCLQDYLAEEGMLTGNADPQDRLFLESFASDAKIARKHGRDYYFVKTLEKQLTMNNEIEDLHGRHPIFSKFFNVHEGDGSLRVFDLHGFWYPDAYSGRYSDVDGPIDFWNRKFAELLEQNNDLEMNFDLPRINEIKFTIEVVGDEIDQLSSEYLDRIFLYDESFRATRKTPMTSFEPYVWAACDHQLGTRFVNLSRADYSRNDGELEQAVRKYYSDAEIAELKCKARERIRNAYMMMARRDFVNRMRIRIYEPDRGDDEVERDWAVELLLGETLCGSFLGFSVTCGPHSGLWGAVTSIRKFTHDQQMVRKHGYPVLAAYVDRRLAATTVSQLWRLAAQVQHGTTVKKPFQINTSGLLNSIGADKDVSSQLASGDWSRHFGYVLGCRDKVGTVIVLGVAVPGWLSAITEVKDVWQLTTYRFRNNRYFAEVIIDYLKQIREVLISGIEVVGIFLASKEVPSAKVGILMRMCEGVDDPIFLHMSNPKKLESDNNIPLVYHDFSAKIPQSGVSYSSKPVDVLPFVDKTRTHIFLGVVSLDVVAKNQMFSMKTALTDALNEEVERNPLAVVRKDGVLSMLKPGAGAVATICAAVRNADICVVKWLRTGTVLDVRDHQFDEGVPTVRFRVVSNFGCVCPQTRKAEDCNKLLMNGLNVAVQKKLKSGGIPITAADRNVYSLFDGAVLLASANESSEVAVLFGVHPSKLVTITGATDESSVGISSQASTNNLGGGWKRFFGWRTLAVLVLVVAVLAAALLKFSAVSKKK